MQVGVFEPPYLPAGGARSIGKALFRVAVEARRDIYREKCLARTLGPRYEKRMGQLVFTHKVSDHPLDTRLAFGDQSRRTEDIYATHSFPVRR
jgi:hypothetical protein